MKLKGERVSSEIIKEISMLLLTDVKDEDLKNVTITYANVSNDLSFAKVYFTTLDDYKKDKVLRDMNNAAGYFRSELAKRMDLRTVPELRFIYDDSIEYGKKIENIIEKINSKEN